MRRFCIASSGVVTSARAAAGSVVHPEVGYVTRVEVGATVRSDAGDWQKGKERVKRTIAKVPGFLLAVACLGLLVYGLGCVSDGSSSDEVRQTARQQLAAGNFIQAEASYLRAEAWSTDSGERTKALLGIGIARLERGEAKGAVKAFRDAEQTNRNVALQPLISRQLGFAYLAQGHHYTAQRYLRQSLPSAKGEQREVVLARLALCSHKLHQETRAKEYESLLIDRNAPSVSEILADRDPLMRAAKAPRSPRAGLRSSGISTRLQPAVARSTHQPVAEPMAVASRVPERTRARLSVKGRSRWRARPRRGNILRMRNVSRITVHHAAGKPNWAISERDVADSIRKIQRYHQTENGWADIGYHYVIDRAGRVWQGREMKWQGAHAGGSANKGNVGIVLLGNYSRQQLNPAQKNSLRTLVGRLSVAFNVPQDRIFTHREIHGKTECPGTHLQRFVDSLRAQIRRYQHAHSTLGD